MSESNLPTITHSYKDKEDPRSLINITPASISNRLEMISDDFLDMGEKELKKLFTPSEIEERLRVSFWMEYDRAQTTGKQMNISNVYQGICSQTWFLRKTVARNVNLAYMLTPPKNYLVEINNMLNLSNEQMRSIIEAPHIRADGSLDAKAAQVKVNIWESLLLRAKGAVPHVVQSQNLNLNVERKEESSTPIQTGADLDERIKHLEAQINGDIIDVKAEEESSSEEGGRDPQDT